VRALAYSNRPHGDKFHLVPRDLPLVSHFRSLPFRLAYFPNQDPGSFTGRRALHSSTRLLLYSPSHSINNTNVHAPAYSHNNGVSFEPVEGDVSVSEEDLTGNPSLTLHRHSPVPRWRYDHQPTIHRKTLPGDEQSTGCPKCSHPHRYLHQNRHGCRYSKILAREEVAYVSGEESQRGHQQRLQQPSAGFVVPHSCLFRSVRLIRFSSSPTSRSSPSIRSQA
jgi:hypothetical protein